MDPNIAFLCLDISRLFRKHFAEMAREFGGTGAQWRALNIVKRFPGINQGALADRLDVEPITACRLVDRLEQSELIERRRDPADRRAWQLFVTEAALPITQSMQEVGTKLLDKATDDMDGDEIATLLRLLEHVRDNLAKSEEHNGMTQHG